MTDCAFDLYIDFKCPASYLAVAPTIELAQKHGASIGWQPRRARIEPIPIARADETVSESHRRVRAVQRRQTHLHYAEVQGIEMAFRDEAGESDVALAALQAVTGDRTAFVRRCFDSYWVEGEDLDDIATVQRLLAECDVGIAVNLPDDAKAAIDDWQQRLGQDGIFMTPTYLVAGQLFVGREHLPWIEYLLSK